MTPDIETGPIIGLYLCISSFVEARAIHLTIYG